MCFLAFIHTNYITRRSKDEMEENENENWSVIGDRIETE